jgi:hypothetical protein
MGFTVSLHGSNPEPPMSALGHKRTSEGIGVMSALPPKADIGSVSLDVRFVPKADIGSLKQRPNVRYTAFRLNVNHQATIS